MPESRVRSPLNRPSLRGPLPRKARFSIPTVAASLAIGCASDAPEPSPVVVRDSAGIRWIDLPESLNGITIQWTFSGPPEYVIENDESDVRYQLLQVVDAFTTSRDGIAVALAGSDEVRYYGPFEEFERSVGRSGEGPGEFQRIGWMRSLPGDSLAVGDLRIRRITVFDPEGGVVRIVSTAEAAPSVQTNAFDAAPEPRTYFDDGRFLTASYQGYPPNSMGSVRPDVTLWMHGVDASVAEPVATFPNDENFIFESEGRTSIGQRAFSRSTYYAYDRDGFWVGDNDRWEIRGYSSEGELRTVLRRDPFPFQELPVTESLIRREIEERYRDVPDSPESQAIIEERVALEPHETMPAYSGIMTDSSGRLWVRAFERAGASTITWMSIDLSDGTPGILRLQPSLRPIRFEGDRLIAVSTDDLGRESLHRYRLTPR